LSLAIPIRLTAQGSGIIGGCLFAANLAPSSLLPSSYCRSPKSFVPMRTIFAPSSMATRYELDMPMDRYSFPPGGYSSPEGIKDFLGPSKRQAGVFRIKREGPIVIRPMILTLSSKLTSLTKGIASAGKRSCLLTFFSAVDLDQNWHCPAGSFAASLKFSASFTNRAFGSCQRL